jgi:hypothetical protein
MLALWAGKSFWHLWKKKGLTFDSSVYNHKIVNNSCVSRRKVMKPCHA